MKPVKIKYYIATADWSEGPEEFKRSPYKEVCEKAIEDWDFDMGFPIHGFSVRERYETGYIVDEE